MGLFVKRCLNYCSTTSTKGGAGLGAVLLDQGEYLRYSQLSMEVNGDPFVGCLDVHFLGPSEACTRFLFGPTDDF
jgi:hypothetical protein